MRVEIPHMLNKDFIEQTLKKLNYKILYDFNSEIDARKDQYHFYFSFGKRRTTVKGHIDWGIPHQRPAYESKELRREFQKILDMNKKMYLEDRLKT